VPNPKYCTHKKTVWTLGQVSKTKKDKKKERKNKALNKEKSKVSTFGKCPAKIQERDDACDDDACAVPPTWFRMLMLMMHGLID